MKIFSLVLAALIFPISASARPLTLVVGESSQRTTWTDACSESFHHSLYSLPSFMDEYRGLPKNPELMAYRAKIEDVLGQDLISDINILPHCDNSGAPLFATMPEATRVFRFEFMAKLWDHEMLCSIVGLTDKDFSRVFAIESEESDEGEFQIRCWDPLDSH